MKKLNKIVFIDDDILANEHHESVSRKADVAYETLSFSSSEMALDYLYGLSFRPKFPELIFVNVHIPNGYRFIRQVQRFTAFDERHTHLAYLVTALCNADIAAFFKYGLKHFYFKPFDETDLVKAVKEIFRHTHKKAF